MTFFTISHQKKVEKKQPPKGLQFHGEESEFDDKNNHGEEVNFWQQRTSIFMIEEALPNQII